MAISKALAASIALFASLISAQNDCCSKLVEAFADLVVLPPGINDAFVARPSLYDRLNSGRFSNTAILAPSCILRPTTTEEVSQAVRLLVGSQCQFSIKSGGHMAVPGANNINDGVSVDLRWLNSTELSDDKSVALLGAGGTWLNAYSAFDDQLMAFPGGVCGTTGVGGVSLGGGESYFQPSRGWVVDNVLNYQLVLGSGEIVDANQTSNPDLYRALKGGSSNFGIVTRVDVITAPGGHDLWAGQVVVPAYPQLIAQTLVALTDFTAVNNIDIHSGVQTVFSYYHNGSKVIVHGVGNIENVEYPEALQGFTSQKPQVLNTAHHRTLVNWVEEVDTVQPPGFRDLSATFTFENDLETIQAVHNVTEAIYASIKDIVPELDFVFFYVPQPKVIQSHSAKLGGNVLGLAEDPRDEIVTFIVPRWSDATHDDIMFDAARRWNDEVTAVAKAYGTYRPFKYINFSWDFQKPLCGYGPDNVRFLQETAKKYDPEEVFQKLVPGGFKVSQAC